MSQDHPPPPQAALVGRRWEGGEHLVTAAEIAAFAQATDDLNPRYAGDAPVAPPMFHVRPMRDLLFMIIEDEALGLDVLRLVHGEHDARFSRLLRAGERLRVAGELLSAVEKRSGLVITAQLTGDVGEERVVECTTVFFIRAKPSAEKPADKPAEKAAERPAAPPPPDWTAPVNVAADASYRYAQASGDVNPIHIHPETARRAGLPDVILHGLCTMALTARALTDGLADGDPGRLRRLSVRWARPVLNGQTLTVTARRAGEGAWAVETLGPDGKPVITAAVAELG
ncbi:MaoC family dehydratase N-terminal domain-containing protein [Myxococcota bacterium]|nr:MaoC family dehydratase N-terminal domain-containing protein [Myxococcota bacterium]